MKTRDIKVGLSTLCKMNEETESLTARVEKLEAAKAKPKAKPKANKK